MMDLLGTPGGLVLMLLAGIAVGALIAWVQKLRGKE